MGNVAFDVFACAEVFFQGLLDELLHLGTVKSFFVFLVPFVVELADDGSGEGEEEDEQEFRDTSGEGEEDGEDEDEDEELHGSFVF